MGVDISSLWPKSDDIESATKNNGGSHVVKISFLEF